MCVFLRLTGILVLLAGASWAQPTPLLEFVRPPELQPPLETAPLTGRESVQEQAGAHQGHRILMVPGRLCAEGAPPYAVQYHACLQKDQHPGVVELVAKEGLSGIGLTRPSGSNWYAGGCIDVVVNGQGLAPHRPKLERTEDARAAVQVAARWEVPWGQVGLRFLQTPGDDKCFVVGELECPEASSLTVRLRCFPAGYARGDSRLAMTASAERHGPGRLILRPLDNWIWCGDSEHDRDKDPQGSGSCAVMFSRSEVLQGVVSVSQYPVEITLTLAPELKRFHLLLWEMPTKTNAEAIAHMRQLGEQHPATLGDVATTPVRTEDVPPRALTVDGEPAATIWLAEEPADRICEAALELQRCVQKASGAVLPIAIGGERPEGHVLRVVHAPAEGDSPEGFSLRVAADEALIEGRSALGALYGTYELLERGLDVRWYLDHPLGEIVPEQKTITLPELDVSAAPSFPMRWIGRGQWALRNKQNPCPDGFHIWPSIYHTQNALLPHGQHFEEHPEYFALIKGERSQNGQCKLCYSNPEVARQIARRMARELDASPNISLLSLSPTDGQMWCECDNCRAMDEEGVPKDQSMSRRSLLFYNAVAAELRKTHPEAQILVGAYNVYNWPPKDQTIKADPMLAVVITHYEDYCMAHPVADATCPRNKRYVELITAWEDLGCKVYYYEYYWKVNWLDLPWPIVHCIREDMPWYHRREHRGVYTQYTTDNVWSLFPGYYIAARMLWDVDLDVDATVSRMYEDLFGAAAEPMKQYYALMEERMAACGQHFPGHGLTAGQHVFTPEVRGELRSHWEQADRLNNDPVVAQRLAKIGLSLEYADRLMEYARLRRAVNDSDDRAAAATAAREHLEKLVEELRSDRGKWGGIVSRSIVAGQHYLSRDLENAKKAEAKLRATQVEEIAPLPTTWKFALDREDTGTEQKWFAAEFDDSGWQDLEIARTWEEQGHEYDGYAWYRLRWRLKPEWLEGPVALHFEAVDGEAWVYWNGELLGHHEGWDEPFALPLPPDAISRDADNLIAVRVFDGSNQGGIWKPARLVKAE